MEFSLWLFNYIKSLLYQTSGLQFFHPIITGEIKLERSIKAWVYTRLHAGCKVSVFTCTHAASTHQIAAERTIQHSICIVVTLLLRELYNIQFV